jgi:membrane protein DedA with SNARE-associated domain
MSLFDLFDWVKALIERFGYFGVFLGTFLESVFPPIPSEVIMGFSGFLISEGKFNWPLVVISAVLGNMLSVSLIWYLGHKYGRDFLLKWGKYIGVTSEDVKKGEDLFTKHGYKVVFLCQMVPLARSWIAFPAGIMKTNYLKFILTNTAGAAIWLTVLTYLGFIAGENWDQISETLKPFEYVFLAIFVIFALVWGYRVILVNKLSKKEV